MSIRGELAEMRCCGVDEYDGINDNISAVDMLLDISWQRHEEGYAMAHVIFTVVETENSVYQHQLPALRKLIKEEKLGQMVVSRTKVNKNSGNKVRACIYTPAYGRLLGWSRKQKRWIDEMAAKTAARAAWQPRSFFNDSPF